MVFGGNGPTMELRGSGPLVCLVPDFARDPSQWSKQTAVLLPRYTLLLIDYGPDPSVKTLSRSLSALLTKKALGPAVLVGSGMGACVALEITARGSGKVCGLVLVSPDSDAGRLEAAATVEVPALVIAGTNDLLAAIAQAEHMARRLPNARLELITGAASEPMTETSVRFNNLLLGFLHQVTRGDAA